MFLKIVFELCNTNNVNYEIKIFMFPLHPNFELGILKCMIILNKDKKKTFRNIVCHIINFIFKKLKIRIIQCVINHIISNTF